jgi:MHS family proline/betaine transporter-like MFS transporter
MGLLCVLIPILGAVSDRLGRRPQQIVGTVAYLILAYPLFLVFSKGGLGACFLAHSAFAVIHSAICSPIPAMFVEMFPARVRYSSVSLAFNIALAFFGGSAPLIATWLIRSTKNPAAPGFYLILGAGVTLAALLAVRETHGQGRD